VAGATDSWGVPRPGRSGSERKQSPSIKSPDLYGVHNSTICTQRGAKLFRIFCVRLWLISVLLVSALVSTVSRSAVASELSASSGLEWQRTDQANPGYTTRGGDFISVLGGEIKLKGRLLNRSKAEVRLGGEANFYSEFQDNNNQRYFARIRSSAGRTSLQLKYEFIPKRLYFPSSTGDATYSRHLAGVQLSQELSEDWEASFAYEVRLEDFVQIHDHRDNKTDILELELEYESGRLLRPCMGFEWRNRKAEDDNYDFRAQRIAFSLRSQIAPRLGLELGYQVGDRRYLTPHLENSNFGRIDARSALRAKATIKILKILDLLLGYERREKDSSREEEERSYRVNTFTVGSRLTL